ncbi:helix-turn-helix domain-containing protein [Paenibacillus lutrae]|uniref:Helix-turn-helix domain-containing protein n=1 Tax=Paenibacillus lutrae TaxID=2078573 RepID=A0A7X3JXY7_9BACL|nr:helix-turn-helix domain-containing protein [Paenibacillus lutrae]
MRITAKSEELIRRRMLLGLTQRELARLTGLSHAYISLVERSMKSIGPGAAKRLSSVLGKPVEELFTIQ